MSGPSQTLFDLWSTVYDAELVQRLTYRPVQDAVLDALAEVQPRRIVDVGCGTGLLTARMQEQWPDSVVLGCDFSAGMLARARRRSEGPRWLRCDGQRLPIADDSVDAVTSTESFHWLPDQLSSVAEFARVLRPGGRLVVALVNPPHPAVSTLAWAASRLARQPFYWPTRDQMAQLMVAAGLRVVEQRRIMRLPAGLSLPPVMTVATKPA